MANRVVARFLDGRVLKGQTGNFSPERPKFHLAVADQAGAPRVSVQVNIADLKAVFFVKDLVGDPGYNEIKEFGAGDRPMGRRVKVEFLDGEVLVGTTQGYQMERNGFFLTPIDPRSNNDRCFIVATAVRELTFLEFSQAS
jgi:hypothetical protein